MAAFTRFKFYEVDINESLGLPDNVTCSAQGSSGCIALGCADGTVVRLQADHGGKLSFSAHKGRLHAIACYENDAIITLGEEDASEDSASLSLKVWTTSAISEGLSPVPAQAAALFAGIKHPPLPGQKKVTAAGLHISALEWPSVHAVVGLSGGSLHVFKFDPGKGRLVSVTQQPLVLDGGDDVLFAGIAPTASPSTLWAVSCHRTAAYRLPQGDRCAISDRGTESPAHVALSSHRLAIAGPDAVSFYVVEEGQTSALALTGTKQLLVCGEHHLLVSCSSVGAPASLSSNQSTAISSASSSSEQTHSLLRVVDPKHKLLAGQATIKGAPRWAAHQGEAFAVGTSTGGLLRFKPLPLQQRLAALYRTQAFELAIDIAKTEGVSGQDLSDVHVRYGDALYDKRDYDAALEQYVKTLGHLEASYVIQRLLAVQRLGNLVSYLEKLHAAGLAGPDHMTLLVSCYAKRQDTGRLDAFVDELEMALQSKHRGGDVPQSASSGASSGSVGHLSFDVPGIIAACRRAGYYDHALRAAQAKCDTDTALDILTEDCGRWDQALEAIRKLGRRRAAAAILQHGKGLLEHLPVETTALLMELCVPSLTHPTGTNKEDDDDATFVANLGDYTHLYTGRLEDLRYACGTILNMGGLSKETEARMCVLLLDLFLSAGRENGGPATSAGRQECEQAMDLLKRGWLPGAEEPSYDVGEALVTCRTHDFHEGIVFLYESGGLYRRAGSVLRRHGDDAALIELCRRRGDPSTGGDPGLWRDALEHFAALRGPDAEQRIGQFLSHVEASRALPPLAVLRVLAKNPELKLGLIRDYVARQLAGDDREIAESSAEAARLEREIEQCRTTLARLENEPFVVQHRWDAITEAPLELPSVHFLCGHSYNASTLGDAGGDEPTCPLCAAEQAQAQAVATSNRSWAGDKDAFFKKLRASDDGFGVIAEYLGKGVLNCSSVSGDAAF